jgi:hypothetical protein
MGLNDVDQSRAAAAKEWTSGYRYPREDQETENLLVWGDVPFDHLWSWSCPLPMPEGFGGEPNDFARLACRVWQPLLDAS